MSGWYVVTRRWINCDACGEAYGEDLDLKTNKQAINGAKDNGWELVSGRMLCDDCVAAEDAEKGGES